MDEQNWAILTDPQARLSLCLSKSLLEEGDSKKLLELHKKAYICTVPSARSRNYFGTERL
jgi:hypothetical protein